MKAWPDISHERKSLASERRRAGSVKPDKKLYLAYAAAKLA